MSSASGVGELFGWERLTVAVSQGVFVVETPGRGSKGRMGIGGKGSPWGLPPSSLRGMIVQLRHGVVRVLATSKHHLKTKLALCRVHGDRGSTVGAAVTNESWLIPTVRCPRPRVPAGTGQKTGASSSSFPHKGRQGKRLSFLLSTGEEHQKRKCYEVVGYCL